MNTPTKHPAQTPANPLAALAENADDYAVLDFIQARWPKWEATDADLTEWMKAARAMPNRAALTEAISLHYGESVWKAPTMAKIKTHYKLLTVASGLDAPRESTIGHSGVFIVCVQAPAAKPGYQDFTRELMWGRADQVPTDRGYLAKIAQTMIAHWCKVAGGGRWQIIGLPDVQMPVAPDDEYAAF